MSQAEWMQSHETTSFQEALYYNAVAVAADGDRGRIAKWKRHGTWEHAWRALAARGLPLPGVLPAPHEEWEKLAARGVRLILREAPEFPPLLKEIPHPPFGIYIRGTLPQGAKKSLAIVGTRRATPEGKSIARHFARELALAGMAVVSGLAFGIDSAAHEGCLTADGVTIAVLAGGLADIYPRSHVKLAEKILKAGGALISEYPLHAPAYPLRFLERNRLISGLSVGTVVVEAPRGSGSLVTARHALEANRDVFAVPGPVHHGNYAGSHALIRQGATLVTSPDELLEDYGITREEKLARHEQAASDEERLILKALQGQTEDADVDKIIAMTKLEPRVVNRSLSFLLLRGAVRDTGGGYTINV